MGSIYRNVRLRRVLAGTACLLTLAALPAPAFSQFVAGDQDETECAISEAVDTGAYPARTACGGSASAQGFEGTAIGALSNADGFRSTTLGAFAQATGDNSVAIGARSVAAEDDVVSFGGGDAGLRRLTNVADGVNPNDAVTVGQLSALQSQNNIAVLEEAQNYANLGDAINAFGITQAQQTANNALANAATAQTTADTALANAATAQGTADTALVNAATAQATADQALANTTYFQANSTGLAPQATGADAVAIGPGSVASGARSTALGSNAAATRDDQVALGGAGSSVTIGDITASTAAQAGPTEVMTVDASGTVGRDTTIRPAIAALQAASGAQALQIEALQQGQAQLFDLVNLNRREARRGIAAAVALSAAPFPSAPGRTSYTANTAIYRGEVAFSASVAHRLDVGSPFAVTAGVSHSGGRDTAARVGVAGEF